MSMASAASASVWLNDGANNTSASNPGSNRSGHQLLVCLTVTTLIVQCPDIFHFVINLYGHSLILSG